MFLPPKTAVPKRAMMVTTRRFKILAITGFCLSLVLTGCGRKAGLETPGNPAPVEAAEDAAGTGIPAQVETKNKTFFLDPLIGANRENETTSDDETRAQ